MLKIFDRQKEKNVTNHFKKHVKNMIADLKQWLMENRCEKYPKQLIPVQVSTVGIGPK